MTKKKVAPAAKSDKSPPASGKSAKGTKAAAKNDDPVAAARAAEANGDAEEVDEDEAAAASGGGGGGGGNAAALAAAGSGEMSASFKNFRHHPDMENFYRFIHENDLRHEALAILNTLRKERALDKANKKSGARK
ncbi:MAG: hypothetical protein ACK5QT_02460 [Oligoflexia bacterium]